MDVKTYPWQQELLGTLLAMRGRLPNGVLIHGPRGIGILEAALAFAASLMCTDPLPDGRACGRCKGCRMVRSNTHPDLRLVVSEFECAAHGLDFAMPEGVDEKKNLSREILIGQTRELSEFLGLMSHEGGLRAVVVYPADKLRAEAAASLLKSLEEPPENTVFILAADDLDSVLATIRSRCRLVRAQAPSRAQAEAWLREQGVENPGERLTASAGMPLPALHEDPRYAMSEASRRRLLDYLAAGAAADPGAAVGAVDKDMTIAAAALVLSRWAWDLASAAAGGPVRYFPAYEEALRAVAADAAPAGLFRWINSVRDVRRAADHTLNARVVIEAILLSYARCLARR